MALQNHRLASTSIPLALVAVLSAGLLAGCQNTPMPPSFSPTTAGYPLPSASYGAPSPYESAAYAAPENIEPAAGPSTRQQAPQANTQALEGEVLKVNERLQRVEKAMLRLDRRMQLVERNELGRMGGGPLTMTQQEEQTAMGEMNLGPATAPLYSDGFRPVSSQGGLDGQVTSSLQAAPRLASAASTASAPATARGLPSLADPSPAVGRAPEADLSVWTVRYADTKVWPERDQLPGSRDVVEALRNGKTVTVFARGKHPNAVEFRERVKALSRYLSKVASLETVPIATLPAPHLDDKTIEIFATH
jgi:hypothetical protein